ncbi:MAG: AarF/UbiB family protein [Lentisphaeria bacterium]|jgi:ubiquinone biosynthesis protein
MLLSNLARLGRRYRHFSRYREILTVLFKHGFGDLLHGVGLRPASLWPFRPKAEPVAEPWTRHERVRLAMEELGPTFVKLGQILSTRVDILPPPLIAELEKLQDAVPPFPSDQAKAIVASEFHRPLCDLFPHFAAAPLASASIAQVHRATLPNGDCVVVKIRRPGIETVMETDLEIMADLAGLIERTVPDAAFFEPVRIVAEFSRNLRRELDFTAEARHVERFHQQFAADPRIHVPAVIRQLGTERVITLEFIDGIKISHLAELDASGADRKLLAAHGAKLTMEQVFIHGFFHGDPHPGNIVALPGNVLCYLDYGLMGTLTLRQRDMLGELFLGLAEKDERRIADAILRFSGQHYIEQLPRLEADLALLLEAYQNRPLREIHAGEVLTEIARLMVRYGIHLPADFFLLTKSLAMLEGIGRRLDPEFDIMGAMEPFARRLLRERFAPKRVLKGLISTFSEMGSFLRHLPEEADALLTQVRRGDIRIKFEHRGLDRLAHSLDQTSNRVAFAIVLAALIIGSAIMVHSGIPPKWNGIPIIGLSGFCLSGFMGFSLLWSIFKHGKM